LTSTDGVFGRDPDGCRTGSPEIKSQDISKISILKGYRYRDL